MDESLYLDLRERSWALFHNRLVLPAARVVFDLGDRGGSFGASEIRRQIGGSAESNQIRDALTRLEAIGAISELPYLGRPNPRRWSREDHPFWDFVESWTSAEQGSRATR